MQDFGLAKLHLRALAVRNSRQRGPMVCRKCGLVHLQTSMAVTKLKIVVAAAVVAGLATVLVREHAVTAKLRSESQELLTQLEQFAQPTDQQQSNAPVPGGGSTPRQEELLQELDRLRSEVAKSRAPTMELERLQKENQRLRSAFAEEEAAHPAEAEFKLENTRRLQDLKKWGLMFRVYMNEANGKVPETWEQVASQIPAAERESFLSFASNNYEIVYRGDEKSITNGSGILFREKQARLSPGGKWFKAYGHLDGSASTYSAPDGNFEAYEKKLMIGAQ
jgi:hypothetical protein